MSISEIEWGEVVSITYQKAFSGYKTLAEYLKHLPFEKWSAVNKSTGKTFLHYAAVRGNLDALKMLVSRNTEITLTHMGLSPLHSACDHNCNEEIIEILCAYDTRLIGFRTSSFRLPIEICLTPPYIDLQSIFTLIANGSRLQSVFHQNRITQEMRDFEQGVVRCRDVIVTLLGLKKRKQVLGKLDRFLIKQELSIAIWSTRYQTYRVEKMVTKE